MGFSAGGHLAATLSNLFEDPCIVRTDSIDEFSARPDASILCYPVITFEPPFAHMGSRHNLIGSAERPELAAVCSTSNPHPGDLKRQDLIPSTTRSESEIHLLAQSLSLLLRVTKNSPPAFLFHTADDSPVPVENSLMYAASLRNAGVPFEMHVFETGPHGVGLATDRPALSVWPDLCLKWLRNRGW